MEITKKLNNGVTVISISGRMDANTTPEAEKALMDAINEGATKMVINLKDLAYISSAGLRVLLLIAKELRSKGGKVVICSMVDSVKKVFDISGFTSIFEMKATEGEAIKTF